MYNVHYGDQSYDNQLHPKINGYVLKTNLFFPVSIRLLLITPDMNFYRLWSTDEPESLS